MFSADYNAVTIEISVKTNVDRHIVMKINFQKILIIMYYCHYFKRKIMAKQYLYTANYYLLILLCFSRRNAIESHLNYFTK